MKLSASAGGRKPVMTDLINLSKERDLSVLITARLCLALIRVFRYEE